jgi:hypothetical protein
VRTAPFSAALDVSRQDKCDKRNGQHQIFCKFRHRLLQNAERPFIREKFIVAKVGKAQLNGLLATARGEAVITSTGSVYTITGPVGSKALGDSCGRV